MENRRSRQAKTPGSEGCGAGLSEKPRQNFTPAGRRKRTPHPCARRRGVSGIAAITARGQVLGTAGSGDRYGFTAQSLGPIKLGGVSYMAAPAARLLPGLYADGAIRLV